MMKSKKGMAHFMIISLILALIIFFSYSFFTREVVYKFLDNVGLVEDDLNQSMECIVEPFTNGDSDGDGIRDDVDKCSNIKDGNFFGK